MAGEPLAGGDAYLAGKPCPKCRYVRTIADHNPAWQCPGCHVAYVKFESRPVPVRKRVAAEARELAREARSDYSLFTLIASNVLALVIAGVTNMGLREMMIVYWIQSVMIGITHFVRMLMLHNVNAEGFRTGDPPSGEAGSVKLKFALFFLVHYGGFHLVYIGLLTADRTHGAGGSALGYTLCALVFAANHLYSMVHNIARDTQGQPHVFALMLLPYARIVPMHVTMGLGLGYHGVMAARELFGALKTVADILMHAIDHHVLAWSGKPPAEPS